MENAETLLGRERKASVKYTHFDAVIKTYLERVWRERTSWILNQKEARRLELEQRTQ